MSKGPTGVGSDKKFEKRYYHLKLEEKDWCDYFKKCPMKDNITSNYCWICKYHKKLDIPHLLAERGSE